MPRRIIEINGEKWEVAPSGRVTRYMRDEFGLVFSRGTGANREHRVVRYSPRGSRHWDMSLHELDDRRLAELFARSQPSWTAPETEYSR